MEVIQLLRGLLTSLTLKSPPVFCHIFTIYVPQLMGFGKPFPYLHQQRLLQGRRIPRKT